ncbi:MAG: peptidogalycan biosysnthesis protein, partial [Roseovarius sp.]
MSETALIVTAHDTIHALGAGPWDACACPEAGGDGRPGDPFTTHRFLAALEDSGSVGPGSGWHPHHLTVTRADEVIACAPLYLKGHSQGEYIF